MVFALALLSACGGGGGSTSPVSPPTVTPTATTLSGVAAAGSPIAGIVNVKGANGATASSTISVDGSYSIDVGSLTAPYILYAEGSVNGKSIKVYSVAVATGTINITPITDFIVRNALAGPAESAFDSWDTTQVSETALSAAETDVQALLLPVLTGAGVGSNVDLLTTAFSADHSGIDAVLDILDINITGNTATIENTLTGSSFTDDITMAGDSTGLPATDTTAVQTALTDVEAIDAFWKEVATMLTAFPYPSNQTWTGWVNTHVAEDYLWGGESRAELLADLIFDDDDGAGNLTFDAVILEPLDVTSTVYTRGYWIRVFESNDEGQDTFVVGMVYDGINWLLYGDQRWLEANDVNSHAFYADLFGTFGTGFELGLDDDFKYAYDKGVRSAIVIGPGLPTDGVLLAHQFPETFIGLYTNGASFYEITDDALIAAIPDNAEYTYTLCSETADALNTNGHNTCTVLDTYTTITAKPPLPMSALNAAMFPALTSPNSHDLSVLNFGGLIDVSVSTPVDKSLDDFVDLCWQSSGASYCAGADLVNATATIDTIGLPAPDSCFACASIFVRASDIYGRDFNRHWVFSNF